MAPVKKTKKKTDGTRTSVHGRTKYYSYPADNQACPMRCSPPTRRTEQDGTRKTTVKYRHRTLDITSSGRSAKPTTAKKTEGKKTAAKPKTVKKTAVKKATAKPTATKTSAVARRSVRKPDPTSGTPVGRYIDGLLLKMDVARPDPAPPIYPTNYVRKWYVLTWPNDKLGQRIDPTVTFGQVRHVSGKAISGVIKVDDPLVRRRIEKGYVSFYRENPPARRSASETRSGPNGVNMNEPVGVICYGNKEAWSSRR